MRSAYVQQAVVELAADGDPAALGGAVTVALCGGWEHEPPCPLSPHHTSTEQGPGSTVAMRTVFVVESSLEDEVRERIARALARGQQAGPDGALTTWRLVSCDAADLDEGEHALAARLMAG